LQDEIKPEFLIEEDGAGAAREKYLRENGAEAAATREKEMVRQERKAARADVEEEGDGDVPEPDSDG
jgi:hypothetical protein